MSKKFKVVSKQGIRSIYWQIIQVGHPRKGDFVMAQLYDQVSVKIFSESLLKQGFTELEVYEGQTFELYRDVVSGTVCVREDKYGDQEYYLQFPDGSEFPDSEYEPFMLLEEIDKLLSKQGKEIMKPGSKLTIIVE